MKIDNSDMCLHVYLIYKAKIYFSRNIKATKLGYMSSIGSGILAAISLFLFRTPKIGIFDNRLCINM